MKKLMTFLAVCMSVSVASASFVISPNISYQSSKTEQTQPSTSSSEGSEMLIDARVGYVLPTGLFLGGMYSSIKSTSGNTDSSGFMVGPSVGYYSMSGFFAMLTYHIMGEYGTSAAKYTGAKGPQVDLGWIFPITAYFSMGPQITWRSLDYNKLEGSGTSVDADLNSSTIRPYISLWFMF